MTSQFAEGATWAVFAVTYAGLAVGRWPGLRTDRAGIALVGATAALATGLISFPEAVSTDAVDYPTLALLFGMMLVVGYLRIAGVFRFATAKFSERRENAARFAGVDNRPVGNALSRAD